MSEISEQVKELRKIADRYEQISEGDYIRILQAADTIETLSAKPQAENMERLGDEIIIKSKLLDRIYNFVEEHRYDDEVKWTGDEWWLKKDSVVNIIKNMERPAAYYGGGWIPCNERLPEEYDSIFSKFKGTEG